MPIRSAILVLLVFLVAGCDSSDDGTDTTLRAPGGRTPVAGAIEFRDENNVLLGILGAGPVGSGYVGTFPPPSGNGGCDAGDGETCASPASFYFGSAYPNPTRGRANVNFSLPRASEVAVFVVAALPPGSEAGAAGSQQQGAWVYRPGGLAVAVLHEGPLPAGYQQVELDFTELGGRPFPEGYYRVYAQTPYVIAWTDVLYDLDFPY
jgi:hypothetical protein